MAAAEDRREAIAIRFQPGAVERPLLRRRGSAGPAARPVGEAMQTGNAAAAGATGTGPTGTASGTSTTGTGSGTAGGGTR